MIPIRDTIPSRSQPVVNIGLIIANTVVFLYQTSLGPRVEEFINDFGLIPVRFWHLIEKGVDPIAFGPLFSSMFLHGGWFHIIGNMWYLWIFGDNVEDRMGHFRYLVFYILCGLSAGFVHLITNAKSGIPTVGASGAIAGIMGAYFMLFPLARIWTLVPVFIFMQFVEIPALVYLGLWFVYQFLLGSLSLGLGPSIGGIAWWAHIGGFVSGAILVFVFKKRRVQRRFADEHYPW